MRQAIPLPDRLSRTCIPFRGTNLHSLVFVGQETIIELAHMLLHAQGTIHAAGDFKSTADSCGSLPWPRFCFSVIPLSFSASRCLRQIRKAVFFSGREKGVLATKEEEGPLVFRLWDAMTGEETITFASDLEWATEIAISNDRRLLAAQDKTKGLYLWNALEGKQLARVHGTGSAEGDNQTMAFAPNSKLLAVEEAGERRVQIFDTTSGDRIAVFDAPLSAIAFAPDGKSIAHMDWDSRTRKARLLWNTNSGPRRLERRPNVSSFVIFSPDGTMVVTACDAIQGKYEVSLWDSRTLQERAPLDLGDWRFLDLLTFSPDSRLLLALSKGEGAAIVWDVLSQPPQKRMHFTRALPAFTRDGLLLAVEYWETGTVELWDTRTFQKLAAVQWSPLSTGNFDLVLGSVTLSPDGRFVALAGVENHEETPRAGLAEWIGRRLGVWPDLNGTYCTQVWDTTTGKQLAIFKGVGIISPDGRTLLTYPDDEAKLWDLPLRRPIEYQLGVCLSILLLGCVAGSWGYRKVGSVP
jgi:WD40 repeat protein